MHWIANFGIALTVLVSSIFAGASGFFNQVQPSATTTQQTTTRQVTIARNTLQQHTNQNETTNQNAGGTFSANQTSGTAPLPVSFSYSNLDQNDTYKIDFGDMVGDPIVMHCRTSSACAPGSISHTYALPGVYVATLNKQNEDFSCAPHVSCDPPGPTTIPLKITISGVSSMSATIDQSSLVPTAYGVNLTGTASNANSLWVDAIDASYTGPTDYFSLLNSDRACGTGGFRNECFSVSITNGRWSAQMKLGGGTGTHHVYVFDGGATHLLLTSGTFTSN